MAKFNIKQLLIRAAIDYVGVPFPDWYKKNQKKYVVLNIFLFLLAFE